VTASDEQLGQRYNQIVVIDAQGFILGRGVSLPRALEDSKASGVTAVNIPLGTTEREGLFEKTIAGIGEWEARLAAHPDRLLKIRSARDIESAKVPAPCECAGRARAASSAAAELRRKARRL
jgi:hypothetical protein